MLLLHNVAVGLAAPTGSNLLEGHLLSGWRRQVLPVPRRYEIRDPTRRAGRSGNWCDPHSFIEPMGRFVRRRRRPQARSVWRGRGTTWPSRASTAWSTCAFPRLLVMRGALRHQLWQGKRKLPATVHRSLPRRLGWSYGSKKRERQVAPVEAHTCLVRSLAQLDV